MARCLPGPRDQYPLRDLISAEPPGTEAAAAGVCGNVCCIRRMKSPLLPALAAGSGVSNVFPHLPPAHAPVRQFTGPNDTRVVSSHTYGIPHSLPPLRCVLAEMSHMCWLRCPGADILNCCGIRTGHKYS